LLWKVSLTFLVFWISKVLMSHFRILKKIFVLTENRVNTSTFRWGSIPLLSGEGQYLYFQVRVNTSTFKWGSIPLPSGEGQYLYIQVRVNTSTFRWGSIPLLSGEGQYLYFQNKGWLLVLLLSLLTLWFFKNGQKSYW
jgi:hypothetical protein